MCRIENIETTEQTQEMADLEETTHIDRMTLLPSTSVANTTAADIFCQAQQIRASDESHLLNYHCQTHLN